MTTAFVTLCNERYLGKALQTIKEIRGIGQWVGDIVLISVDFTLSREICDKYRVISVQFPTIPTELLREHYKKNPLSIPTCDGREYTKVVQWEKLHVFDMYFKQWERIIYVDAGLSILDNVDAFVSLDWKGRFLAPDDTWNDETKRFRCQLETTNTPDILNDLYSKYGQIGDEKFFLNCIWIYDTSLITETSKKEMVEITNKYPLWRTNEMGVMNIFFTFSLKVWTPFPTIAKNGKYLFDWCEMNRPNTKWYEYCSLKYAVTIPKGKTIGIAIPCYNKHIPKLLECLESIDAQTRKPDVVSISCSSTAEEEFPILRKYGFPVLVSTCRERKNAAQNRNIAARRLDTEVISFFDADDHMHPQRIEGLYVAFSEPCDIVLHNYFTEEEVQFPYPHISTFHVIRNKLSQCKSGCIKLDYNARIHHSQVTVRKEIFEQAIFPEEKEYENKEDCVFCYSVFNIPGIQTAYLNNPLSKYTPGLTMYEYLQGK